MINNKIIYSNYDLYDTSIKLIFQGIEEKTVPKYLKPFKLLGIMVMIANNKPVMLDPVSSTRAESLRKGLASRI